MLQCRHRRFGVRIGHLADSRLIARKIGETCEKIVMAPDLLRRLGKPKDFADLQKNYPLAAVLNQQAMLWKTSPASTELEEVAVGWLRMFCLA